MRYLIFQYFLKVEMCGDTSDTVPNLACAGVNGKIEHQSIIRAAGHVRISKHETATLLQSWAQAEPFHPAFKVIKPIGSLEEYHTMVLESLYQISVEHIDDARQRGSFRLSCKQG